MFGGAGISFFAVFPRVYFIGKRNKYSHELEKLDK